MATTAGSESAAVAAVQTAASADGSRDAAELDSTDALAPFRARFSLPARAYLCGNSLGPMPHATAAALTAHVQKWAEQGVDAHFAGEAPWAEIEDAAAQLSLPVVGARFVHEVVYMNSLTVNLHLMMTAFYRPCGVRRKVLVEEHAFPSDEYAVQTHLSSRGVDPTEAIVRVAPREGEALVRDDDVLATIRELARTGELALVLMPGVQYYTGQVFAMEDICSVCRDAGVPVGFDLAHAVGNVELDLHAWGADFAVWCTYKYLNAGPGAVAGAFVHDRHADAELPRLGGWWGHERATRFAMGREFRPQRGAPGFQLSNPPVLAMVPVAAALQVLQDAGGMRAVRAKSERMTAFLHRELKQLRDVDVITPLESHRRGCQVSLRIRRTGAGSMHDVNTKLASHGVVCDVREPDVLRVAAAPLYNSFGDIDAFIRALVTVLAESKYGEPIHDVKVMPPGG